MRKHVTELGLAAWPYKVHHQKSGDFQCDLVPVIFFHQCERKIDPGSNSSRSPDSVVFHKNRLASNNGARELCGQAVTKPPMCHDLFAVEQASRSEQKRARANRSDTTRALRSISNP